MPTINWQKEVSNNPIYPTGTYKVECVGFERTAAKTGTLQIRWKSKILLPEEHEGRFIIDHTSLTEASLWRIANLIDGFGIDLSQLGNMSTDPGVFDNVCQCCIGRTAFWRNEQGKTPQGADKNNIVEYIRDMSQAEVKPMIGGDAPEFVK